MAKKIDLSGQQFGEIIVLEQDIELSEQKKRIYWKCQCSCGRTKSIRTDGLKTIQSCGQCKHDLTGKRFGRLIVLEKTKKDKVGHQYWLCQCDCGNQKEISATSLIEGHTKSCGCLHSQITHNRTFKDITNQRFGKLIAKEYLIKNQQSYWKCECDCGNTTIVATKNLNNGHTQSCGCINYSIGEKNIIDILIKNKITFIKEYTFKDLPKRRYDFYLPDYNRLIEFDGIQHTGKLTTWVSTIEEAQSLQQRDQEKNNYALQNNIPLVRIPHTERDNITLEMLLGNEYLVGKQGAISSQEADI